MTVEPKLYAWSGMLQGCQADGYVYGLNKSEAYKLAEENHICQPTVTEVDVATGLRARGEILGAGSFLASVALGSITGLLGRAVFLPIFGLFYSVEDSATRRKLLDIRLVRPPRAGIFAILSPPSLASFPPAAERNQPSGPNEYWIPVMCALFGTLGVILSLVWMLRK